MSNLYYCGKCAIRLRPFKTGQDLCDMYPDGTPCKLHSSDILECPACGQKLIVANATAFKYDLETVPDNTIKVFQSVREKTEYLQHEFEKISKTSNLQPWDDIDTNGRHGV
jgi:hypothetical protein